MSKEEKIAANIARARAGRSNNGTTTPASDTTAKASETSNEDAKDENKPLRYPYSKLYESDDYLKIEVYDFVPPGFELAGPERNLRLRTTDETFEKGLHKLLRTIILPIPEGVADSNAASWEAGGLGPGGAAIAAVAGSLVGGEGAKTGNIGQSLKEAGGTIMDIVNSVTKTDSGTLRNVVTGTAAGLAANALVGANVNVFFGRSTGLALNPNQQLLFNSTVGRQFTFGWDIVPRGKKEAEMIKEIIREFKMRMAPTRDTDKSFNGLFLKSPSVFRLQYMSGSKPHPFLNKFKTMALTGMSVNYTGSNTYATYDDGTPVHMKLSLGFAELTAIYSGDYKGTGGVGY